MNILVFTASWCGPSKLLGSALSKSELKYDRYDIDSDSRLALANSINAVPTVLLMDGDKELKRFVGFDMAQLPTLEQELDFGNTSETQVSAA